MENIFQISIVVLVVIAQLVSAARKEARKKAERKRAEEAAIGLGRREDGGLVILSESRPNPNPAPPSEYKSRGGGWEGFPEDVIDSWEQDQAPTKPPPVQIPALPPAVAPPLAVKRVMPAPLTTTTSVQGHKALPAALRQLSGPSKASRLLGNRNNLRTALIARFLLDPAPSSLRARR